jgi:hypothetical protein
LEVDKEVASMLEADFIGIPWIELFKQFLSGCPKIKFGVKILQTV